MTTDKNWLIRTKSNHILGPISKEKVLELLHNGSIKADDEVCSGNGFWFFVREEDMVEKYLHGNAKQPFNPISEAKDVLTSGQSAVSPEASQSDITLVEGLNIAMLKAEQEVSSVPKVEEDKTPDLPPVGPTPEVPKKKIELKRPVKQSPYPEKTPPPLKKQSYLKYLGLLGFIILLTLVYFRKTIIRYLFHGEMTVLNVSLIQDAHAQEELPAKKKNF